MAYRRLHSVSACLAVAAGLLAIGLAPALAGSAARTGWRIVKVVRRQGSHQPVHQSVWGPLSC